MTGRLVRRGFVSPKNVVIAVLGGMVALLIAGGVAVATHSNPNELHGCINDRSGVLRVVGDPADCRTGETAISWNKEGPVGPPGPEGADFAGDIYVDVSAVAGPQGPAGADGADGSDGADGADGSDGAQGLPGVSNLQRVTNTASSSDGSLLVATVSCTGGRVVLGGGVQATNSSVNITINRPGVGLNDPGGSGGWTGYASGPSAFNLIVYAICADVS